MFFNLFLEVSELEKLELKLEKLLGSRNLQEKLENYYGTIPSKISGSALQLFNLIKVKSWGTVICLRTGANWKYFPFQELIT